MRLAHMLRLRDETLKNELFPGVFEQLAAVSKSSGGESVNSGLSDEQKERLGELIDHAFDRASVAWAETNLPALFGRRRAREILNQTLNDEA